MAVRQKVEIKLVVETPRMSPKKVASLVDRLIAVGMEEAEDSAELEEYDKDADVVLEFNVGKAKVVGQPY